MIGRRTEFLRTPLRSRESSGLRQVRATTSSTRRQRVARGSSSGGSLCLVFVPTASEIHGDVGHEPIVTIRSSLAIELVVRLRSVWQVTVLSPSPPRSVVTARSVSAIAARLAGQLRTKDHGGFPRMFATLAVVPLLFFEGAPRATTTQIQRPLIDSVAGLGCWPSPRITTPPDVRSIRGGCRILASLGRQFANRRQSSGGLPCCVGCC